MKFGLEILLLIIVVNAVILDKALQILSPQELKRRAYRDPQAKSIYKMSAYEHTLHLLLWIKGSLAAAVLFILLASWSGLGAVIFILIVAWAVKAWKPKKSTANWIWVWAVKVAPAIALIMSYLQPILIRISSAMPKSQNESSNQIYEKQDLQNFLNNQNSKPENRIPESDLKIAFNALTFGDKEVSTIMTPLRSVKIIQADDVIGPLLMDELHTTGFSRFPVAKSGSDQTSPEIIGTLFIKDLIDHTSKGKVSELMDKKVFYINETQKLRGALDAFIKTHHHLFIVVNNFEEIVGVVSIEDVLEQIVGRPIVDEFDKYEDLRAVASLDAKQEHKEHQDNHLEST